MLRFIALQGVRAYENVEHSQRRENITYRDQRRAVELLLQLENNQSIALSILTSQVLVNIWIKWR